MEVHVHPRVWRGHPDLAEEDVVAAFRSTLRSMPREDTGLPPQWVGVGVDQRGRLLQYVAVNEVNDDWLVFHAMQATSEVLRELGLGR